MEDVSNANANPMLESGMSGREWFEALQRQVLARYRKSVLHMNYVM
jgi:hypothetical protein